MWWLEICSLVWLMEIGWLLWLLMWMAWPCFPLLAGPSGSIACSCWMGRCAPCMGCGGLWWACRCSIASLLRVMTCICSGWWLIWPSSMLTVWIWGLCSTTLPWATRAMFPDDGARRVSLEWDDSVASPSVVVMMLISWSCVGTKLMFSTPPVTTSWISCSEPGGSWNCCSCRTFRTSSAGASAESGWASAVGALSLLCDLTCVFRLSKRVNERLQKEQVKGFFPEWDVTCRRLALGSENDFWQMLQL